MQVASEMRGRSRTERLGPGARGQMGLKHELTRGEAMCFNGLKTWDLVKLRR